MEAISGYARTKFVKATMERVRSSGYTKHETELRRMTRERDEQAKTVTAEEQKEMEEMIRQRQGELKELQADHNEIPTAPPSIGPAINLDENQTSRLFTAVRGGVVGVGAGGVIGGLAAGAYYGARIGAGGGILGVAAGAVVGGMLGFGIAALQ